MAKKPTDTSTDPFVEHLKKLILIESGTVTTKKEYNNRWFDHFEGFNYNKDKKEFPVENFPNLQKLFNGSPPKFASDIQKWIPLTDESIDNMKEMISTLWNDLDNHQPLQTYLDSLEEDQRKQLVSLLQEDLIFKVMSQIAKTAPSVNMDPSGNTQQPIFPTPTIYNAIAEMGRTIGRGLATGSLSLSSNDHQEFIQALEPTDNPEVKLYKDLNRHINGMNADFKQLATGVDNEYIQSTYESLFKKGGVDISPVYIHGHEKISKFVSRKIENELMIALLSDSTPSARRKDLLDIATSIQNHVANPKEFKKFSNPGTLEKLRKSIKTSKSIARRQLRTELKDLNNTHTEALKKLEEIENKLNHQQNLLTSNTTSPKDRQLAPEKIEQLQKEIEVAQTAIQDSTSEIKKKLAEIYPKTSNTSRTRKLATALAKSVGITDKEINDIKSDSIVATAIDNPFQEVLSSFGVDVVDPKAETKQKQDIDFISEGNKMFGLTAEQLDFNLLEKMVQSEDTKVLEMYEMLESYFNNYPALPETQYKFNNLNDLYNENPKIPNKILNSPVQEPQKLFDEKQPEQLSRTEKAKQEAKQLKQNGGKEDFLRTPGKSLSEHHGQGTLINYAQDSPNLKTSPLKPPTDKAQQPKSPK